jgi:hypothetical protein
MRSLRHRGLTTREIMYGGVSIGIAQHDDHPAFEVAAQIAFIRVEATHADRVVGAEVGRQVPAAIRRDRHIDRWSIREREIAEDVLSAGRETKQAEGPSVGAVDPNASSVDQPEEGASRACGESR